MGRSELVPTETFVQTQVRHVLERQCAEAFMALVRGPLSRHQFTLLFFDYCASAEATANVAFKTTHSASGLVQSFEALLWRWVNGKKFDFTPEEIRGVAPLPEGTDLSAMLRTTHIPAGVGVVLLVGVGRITNYVATAERQGVAEMILKDLLPNWRAAAAAEDARG